MRYFLIYLLLISCNQTQDKKKQTPTLNQKIKPDTIPSVKSDTLKVDTFSITRLIPEYSKDTSYHLISSISVGTDMQKMVIYSIYRLPRKNAFKILNKKTRKVTHEKKLVPAYSDLEKIDTSFFFNTVYGEYEKNRTAQKFYDNVKSLKNYDIYFATTYGYMHWLIFDKKSDTIFQRTQLLTF